ncbi:P-loop containing nucleoside triphosphate hydrolase protein [Aureobasidium namibiae CBS 147.97]|uniref:RNA helicase n=1 Tax=Aureobasidium namibiae CBS 147.97 TaxID=1043004 RepID=A0A074XHY7_9PEZI
MSQLPYSNPYTGKRYTPGYHFMRLRAAELPVSERMPELLQTIRDNPVTIVVGETGSGKSTQIPKRILESLTDVISRDICLTQPRRVAAESVAERIAKEMKVPLGSVVGLRHRDHDTTSNRTHLEVHSDGTTLALAKVDPTMSSFGVVIIDEAHEHSRDADILLGHLKSLLEERDNLKVIVMSATIDTALFTSFFPQAVVEEVSGRQHKVTVKYLEQPPSDLISEIVKTIIHVHSREMPGDILVFVSGKGEINKVIDGVNRCVQKEMGPLDIYSLHGSHLMRDQNIAINDDQPPPRLDNLGRKVIVSTNSAETSLTIAGVTHIIDSLASRVRPDSMVHADECNSGVP